MSKRPSLRGDVVKPEGRKAAALAAVHRLDSDRETARLSSVADSGVSRRDRTAAGRPLTTTITIDWETLEILRLVAMRRAHKAGAGRPSVSNVIQDLIEAHVAELRREAGL